MEKLQMKAIIFDWGDTVMRDFQLEGPMSQWDRVEAIPGIDRLLNGLQGKLICIIATSAAHSDANEMRKALARAGLDKYFQHFFSRHETGTVKPDPDFFRNILAALDLRADESWAVGNLYEKDVVPAREAGLKTIFFNENGPEKEFPAANHVVRSMPEIAGIVDPI